MDFNDFFNQWYFGEGYPTYSIEWSQNDAEMFMEVIKQPPLHQSRLC